MQRLRSSATVSRSHYIHQQAVAGLGDRAMHERQVFEVQSRRCPSTACPSSQTLTTTQLIYHDSGKTQSDGHELARRLQAPSSPH